MYIYFMKRHRGLKRYYKNLLARNDFEKLTGLNFKDPSGWPPNLHLHFDPYGYGNNSFKRRKPHLDTLFRHFDLIEAKIKEMNNDSILYAVILDYDSGSDALFVGNKDFPGKNLTFKLDDLSSSNTLTNKFLNEYLAELTDFEKLYGMANQAFCFLYKRDAKSPLTTENS
jgi:hypothetical protein